MQIEIFRVPPLGTNCYFITEDSALAILDPGGGAKELIRTIEEKKLSPVSVILTHGHFDHAGAAGELKTHFNIPIYIHSLDASMLENEETSHASRFGYPYKGCAADVLLQEGDTVTVGNTAFTVLHTPGHTKGSICLLSGNTLLSGDTLFRGSVGIFERENKEIMQKSIRRLLALDDTVQVFPGHEGSSTIGIEKQTNPFAKFNWEWE